MNSNIVQKVCEHCEWIEVNYSDSAGNNSTTMQCRFCGKLLPTPAPVSEQEKSFMDAIPDIVAKNLADNSLPKEVEGKAIKDFIGVKVKYDADGQYLWGVNKDGGMQMIAELRGWGAIQNLFANKAGEIDFENAGQFQDILGNWIADQLTAAISQI